MSSESAPRLYLVTPQQAAPGDLAARLAGILAEVPVACVRLSLATEAGEADWTSAVNHLLPVCHAADVPLVVTDHYRLVAPLGLDGVHLAGSRTSVREVRKALGKDRIVGAFAGTSRHQGMTLAEAGADYVSFGPVRAGGALGDRETADDDLFAWWAEMIETPSVAEGGVTLEDARRLAGTADFIVPDHAVWAEEDVVAALKAFAEALPEIA